MLPTKWLQIPSWRSVAAILRWEVLRRFHAGWSEASRGLGLAAIAGILVTLEPILGRQYVATLLPGVAAALLLHPVLRAGGGFTGEFDLPRRWRTLPVPLPWFGLAGFLPRLAVNLMGTLLLLGFFAGRGYSVSFVVHPLYGLTWLLLIPGALGWGLAISSLSMLTGSVSSIRWGFRRVLEWVGAVFVPAASLPSVLYGLHHAVPHAYLVAAGRGLQGGREALTGTLLIGAATSLVALTVGTLMFVVVLDRHVQAGRFDPPV